MGYWSLPPPWEYKEERSTSWNRYQLPSLAWGEGGQEAAPAGEGGAGHFLVSKAVSTTGCGHKLPTHCRDLPSQILALVVQ